MKIGVTNFPDYKKLRISSDNVRKTNILLLDIGVALKGLLHFVFSIHFLSSLLGRPPERLLIELLSCSLSKGNEEEAGGGSSQ